MIGKKIIHSCVKNKCGCVNKINKCSWEIVISMFNNDLNLTNHYIKRLKNFEKDQQTCKYIKIK
mgnify:CR=1 FL=1